jgi:hypothetical protein
LVTGEPLGGPSPSTVPRAATPHVPECGSRVLVDTLIFGLLLYASWAVFKGSSRALILWLFVAGLLAMLFVFNHHATDKLPLSF